MDDERIDFGSLDPSRDEERWEAMISNVVARTVEARGAPEERTVEGQLFAWARPALAIAAVVALVVWGGALAAGALPSGEEAAMEEEPAYALARWAQEGKAPAAMEILQVLGVRHGEE